MLSMSSCHPSGFNPRPPLPGGDAARMPQDGSGVNAFQSTPPVAGGRCRRRGVRWLACAGFNPRPPLPGGDAPRMVPDESVTNRFNPRPPLPGGDADLSLIGFQLAEVSIHAPRCRGAMLPLPLHSCRPDWFQSTPPVAGGRCQFQKAAKAADDVFQSTPPVAGGRCPAKILPVRSRNSFNPRPPLPGGDALQRHAVWQ